MTPVNNQVSFFGENKEYDAFVEKFTPRKTTDDCYTPAEIYEAVAGWVAREYGLNRARFVRPFWPGGDYMAERYPPDAVVVDNPPFSRLSEIYDFYLSRGIRFFLFAPTLSMFSGGRDLTYIPVGADIVYDNGAAVNTSFVTNLDAWRIRTAPDLYQLLKDQIARIKTARTLPKYAYPDNVITSAAAYRFSQYGIVFRVPKGEAAFVRTLDAQRAAGKSIFGGAFLLSERAAAERAAAERAAAERAAAERAAATRWPLSRREMDMIEKLSKGGAQNG